MAALRKRLLRYLMVAILVIVLVLVSAPLLTAAGIRGWIWWATRGQKLSCKIEGIDAPVFRPVTLRGVRLTGNAEVRIDVTAPRVTIGLNLGSIFRMRGHAIHSLVAENLRVADSPQSGKAILPPQRLVEFPTGFAGYFQADGFRFASRAGRYLGGVARTDARQAARWRMGSFRFGRH